MQRKSEYAIFLYTFFMVRSFGSNNYIPSNLFILFHPFSSKKAEKGRKRQKKVRYHGSISLLTCPAVFVRDPTIISDKNVEKGFREIMVRSFGSNNCWILWIEPWLRIAQQLLRYAQPWFSNLSRKNKKEYQFSNLSRRDRKGHQFSNLSQSPFLSVLFKGQVSFALENLKQKYYFC